MGFLVQFPERVAPFVSVDEQDGGPEALVQIKTSHGHLRSWSMPQRNALYLARSALPAFLIVYVIDGEGEPKSYAVHIWGTEIARILLAVRKAEISGASLNRTLTFTLCDAEHRPDLLAWMRLEIDGVGRDYSARKIALRDSVGYEEECAVVRFSVGNFTEERFLDLQLGLLDGVEGERLTVTGKRFGLGARTPRLTLDGARMEIIPNGSEGRMKLRAPDGETVWAQARIYHASTPPGSGRQKVRVVAGYLEITCDHAGRIRAGSQI